MIDRLRFAGWLAWFGVLGCAADRARPPGAGAAADDVTGPARLTCVDLDGDGRGRHCESGPDCDDGDPSVHDGCTSCGLDPQEGCPCSSGETAECHSGAPVLDARGRLVCLVGERRCRGSSWSACEYAQSYEVRGPSRDVGGAGPCGNCDPQCAMVEDFLDQNDLGDDHASGVQWDGDLGGVVLGARTTESRYAWIAMPGGNGTVSKIRTEDGAEVGRFSVGEDNGEPNSPSRTAIDGFGNAYVANRGITDPFDWFGWNGTGNWGTVTKIAADDSFCVDRDGDGIDTSRSSTPEPFGTDECVVWTVRIGNARSSHPRALAIDRGDGEAPEGHIWVGTTNDVDNPAHVGGRAYQLHPATGDVLQSIQLPLSAYGAVADGSDPQRIWFTSLFTGGLAAVRVDTGEVEGPFYPDAPHSVATRSLASYGIATDGDRIWQAGYTDHTRGYDLETGAFCLIDDGGTTIDRFGRPVTDVANRTRGITVRLDEDGTKTVYVVHQGDETTGRPAWIAYWDPAVSCEQQRTTAYYCSSFTASDSCASVVREAREVSWYPRASVRTKTLPAAFTRPLGIGVDSDNRIWILNAGSGDAAIWDPEEDSIVTYPTTPARLTDSYTYSDFTGYQRAVFTSSRGRYWHDYGDDDAVCAPGQNVTWGELSWEADFQPNSRIVWEIRVAGDPDELPFAPPLVAGDAPGDASPVWLDSVLEAAVDAGDLPSEARQYRALRVTAILTSDDNVGTPVLRAMALTWLCLDQT